MKATRPYDCAIISRHTGGSMQPHPSAHPSPLQGERVSVGRMRGALHAAVFLRGCLAVIFAATLCAASHALGAAQAVAAVGASSVGKAFYEQHCAACHGVNGDGNGPAT